MIASIDEKSIIEKLTHFGFDETDSKVYIGLNQFDQITVGNLASKLKIDRTKTYRSLRKLKNLGVVTTTFSNPVVCKAVSPKKALTYIIENKEDEMIMLHKIAKDLTSDLDCIKVTEKPSHQFSFSVIQGRANIYGKIIKTINEAKNDIYIITTIEDIIRMYHTAIPEKINERIEKGGKVFLITEIKNDKDGYFADRFKTTETRVEKLPSKGRIVLEKDNQVVMSGNISQSMSLNDETDSVMTTDSSEINTYMHNLWLHLWNNAKPLRVIN